MEIEVDPIQVLDAAVDAMAVEVANLTKLNAILKGQLTVLAAETSKKDAGCRECGYRFDEPDEGCDACADRKVT